MTQLAVPPSSQEITQALATVQKLQATQALKSVAFDLGSWHSGASCVRQFVSGVGGIGVKVCCTTCGVLCDVEATGLRIPIDESYAPR